jgi:pSer/pThr/pTyr-binding forkhead associated (FHA) protein
MNQPQWGNTHVTNQQRLRFQVLGTGRSVEVDLTEERPVILGRLDPKAGLLPDVDLCLYDGAALGVSRMHAQLTIEQQMIVLADLGSTNNTFVNGRRLSPNEARMVRDGDEIQLGQLKLHVLFVNASNSYGAIA